MTVPLRFLVSNGDLTGAGKLLIVQSGSQDLLAAAIALVQKNHPAAAVSVLLRRGLGELRPELRNLSGIEYLENLGPKAAQVRTLRAREFDGVCVLYSNHPGYWKLKLLPFALGVPTIIGINEHLGCFPINLRDLNRLRAHMVWRLGSRSTFASADLLEDLASSAAAPAKLGYLFAYERLASLRARLRGSPAPWKRGNQRTAKVRETT
jgi:hypothetical protein